MECIALFERCVSERRVLPQVASRRVIFAGGVLMMLFGSLGKFGAVFVAIPEPIAGGVGIVSIGACVRVCVWVRLQFDRVPFLWRQCFVRTCLRVFLHVRACVCVGVCGYVCARRHKRTTSLTARISTIQNVRCWLCSKLENCRLRWVAPGSLDHPAFSAGIVVSVSISNLQSLNMQSSRNLFIFAVALFMGLGFSSWVNQNPGEFKTGPNGQQKPSKSLWSESQSQSVSASDWVTSSRSNPKPRACVSIFLFE